MKRCVGWGLGHPGLGSGRGGQAPEPPFLPGSASAAMRHCWAWHLGAPVSLQGPKGHPDPHGALLWLAASVCLSLPTEIFRPTLATGSHRGHLLQCLAELVTLFMRAGMPILYQVPSPAWLLRCPSSHVSDGTAGVFVPFNITQHLQEQTNRSNSGSGQPWQ